MGKFKQLSFDNELPELTSSYPETRVYKMNEVCLTREKFIGEVALCIYDNEPNTDIRKTIDLLLNDIDMNELVCSGGNTFFSYITNREEKHSRQYDFDSDIVEQEEHPLKSYKVSYDVLIVPTIPTLQRRKIYKRSEETVQATCFREAKEMVKQKLTDLEKVTKSFTVEFVNTEI